MDKIWYRNPSMSEVIGGDEKRMTTQNRQNRTLKTPTKKRPSLCRLLKYRSQCRNHLSPFLFHLMLEQF